jgi:signal transduction histidine kinase
VVKHARADQVDVLLRCVACASGEEGVGWTVLELKVVDDGRGFDPERVSHDCLGLGIMRERVESIDAALTVESQPGHGTRVTVVWPAGA